MLACTILRIKELFELPTQSGTWVQDMYYPNKFFVDFFVVGQFLWRKQTAAAHAGLSAWGSIAPLRFGFRMPYFTGGCPVVWVTSTMHAMIGSKFGGWILHDSWCAPTLCPLHATCVVVGTD